MDASPAMDSPISPSRGTRRFQEVSIDWMIDAGAVHCHVGVSWLGQRFAEALLDREHGVMDFALDRAGQPGPGVDGSLSFDAATGILRLMSLRYAGGVSGEQQLFPATTDPQAQRVD